MNLTLSILAPAVAVIGFILTFWKWFAARSSKQDERLKATLLGVQWLMNKANDKPDTYLSDRVRDALKD